MSHQQNESTEELDILAYHPRNLSAVPMDLAQVLAGIEAENEVLAYHPRNLSAVPMNLAEILCEIEASNS